MCKCGCSANAPKESESEETQYYCQQCNALKTAKKGEARPECCGKKMADVD
jgi:hypothetical protein